MACLAAAVLLLSGCTAGHTLEASQAEEQTTPSAPAYTPTVETSRPVSNYEASIVNTCNREPGAGVVMSFDDYGTPEQVNDLLEVLEELNWRAAR